MQITIVVVAYQLNNASRLLISDVDVKYEVSQAKETRHPPNILVEVCTPPEATLKQLEQRPIWDIAYAFFRDVHITWSVRPN